MFQIHAKLSRLPHWWVTSEEDLLVSVSNYTSILDARGLHMVMVRVLYRSRQLSLSSKPDLGRRHRWADVVPRERRSRATELPSRHWRQESVETAGTNDRGSNISREEEALRQSALSRYPLESRAREQRGWVRERDLSYSFLASAC